MNVLWMRGTRTRISHVFLEIDTSAGFAKIEPVGPCGRFRVDELRRDFHAQRCRSCKRALRELR